jgi:hypothetical protein
MFPKESFWTGGAINSAEEKPIGFGGLGDLYSALGNEEVRTFQKKEFQFIVRGLEQHDKIKSYTRVHDRLYAIERTKYDELSVVFLNEHELTADHIRTARDRYGAFTDLVITNPNGRATSSAVTTAETFNVQILKWGEFLGRLNRK